MPTEQAARLLAKLADQQQAVAHANAKVRADERFAALEAFQYGHAVFLWTAAAGRVRCRTMDAFDAVQRGARRHADAPAEPGHPGDALPFASPRYVADADFRAQVHEAARRDHPANLPIKCAKCLRDQANAPRRDDRPRRDVRR